MASTTQTQDAPSQPAIAPQIPKPTESSPAAAGTQGGASEKEVKEQKAFERWTKTLSLITGIGLSQEEFQAEIEKIDRKQCELRKEQLIKTSPGVRFMMNNLVKAGCPLTKNMLECGPCDNTKSGGFSKDHGILLCQNGFFSKKHQEHTMIHEMIHMYDHCVFNLDWDNLRHHACSEVRAAALSGDCNWSREVRRGFYTFTKQHQECVKRRATLSVAGNPKCPSRDAAEKAVNAVFESCYNDTRPFDEFY
ncbi:Mitochondrial inner membrane protease atp23 [Linnemannia schmuckeri]|uniref:Mitochondrial inner membrane protease ATP23 n=1 Tax=Linnemannia schmuckeri TaxID=64567 RepID=A0A9P5VAY4_9FUNG|nr:Mitochondrial inner membrane protease atp23 [Linnemannia schmuckeri]